MAYLILEGGGAAPVDSGGYFDFDPQNSNEVTDVKNLLSARRNGKNGFTKPVSLLCSSSDECITPKMSIFSLLQRLLAGKKQNVTVRRPTRTIPAISLHISKRRRTGRSTSDLSAA